ncbi:MAG: TetR/AcrR family transcriptional regulator [Trueperaceae bacterium]
MESERPAPYRDAKRAGRDAVAEGLLELADARLASEGPGGLSMRRLANAAGCSTMVFYTAFGDKARLMEALAAREVDRWIDAALTHADPDPIAWLDATGRALLALASERPHHRDLVLAPPAVHDLGAAVQAAIADAWAASVPGSTGADVAAAVWSAWRGALAGGGDAAEATQVHAGVLRLWSATLNRAMSTTGDAVVP